MNKKFASVAAGGILLFFALACGSPTATPVIIPGGATAPAGGSGTDATKAPVKAQRLKIGDSAVVKGLKITVVSSKIYPATDSAKPKEGQQFVGIEVVFENTGTEPQNVSSMLSFKLKDGEGQEYNEDFMSTLAIGKKSPGGQIAAGDKLRGTTGYSVPKDAKGLNWTYAEGFGGNAVIWDVQPDK